jgi:Protein of unknown function (DUF2865)
VIRRAKQAVAELILLVDRTRTRRDILGFGVARHGCTLVLMALALSASLAGNGLAQDMNCDRLLAAINASHKGGDDPGRDDRAAERQGREIDRTRDYAASIGCDDPRRSDFDDGAPPQCASINAQLARMQSNLAAIEAQSRQSAGLDEDERHAALIARYNAVCSPDGRPADPPPSQGADNFFPEEGRNPADGSATPGNPDDLSGLPLGGSGTEEVARPRSSGRAICVRSCDGGFFPLASKVPEDQLSNLDQLCKASCPNTEAKLYTTGPEDSLDSATAIDGTPYTSLPAAFKFEKTFDATCTCKPPGQSWVEALADAEKLLEERKGDVTVTPQMSDQLSKAGPVPKGKASRKTPTGSAASAGTPPGPAQKARILRSGDGQTKEVKGPDGVTRTVRVINAP